jgi:hypothetical protein
MLFVDESALPFGAVCAKAVPPKTSPAITAAVSILRDIGFSFNQALDAPLDHSANIDTAGPD